MTRLTVAKGGASAPAPAPAPVAERPASFVAAPHARKSATASATTATATATATATMRRAPASAAAAATSTTAATTAADTRDIKEKLLRSAKKRALGFRTSTATTATAPTPATRRRAEGVMERNVRHAVSTQVRAAEALVEAGEAEQARAALAELVEDVPEALETAEFWTCVLEVEQAAGAPNSRQRAAFGFALDNVRGDSDLVQVTKAFRHVLVEGDGADADVPATAEDLLRTASKPQANAGRRLMFAVPAAPAPKDVPTSSLEDDTSPCRSAKKPALPAAAFLPQPKPQAPPPPPQQQQQQHQQQQRKQPSPHMSPVRATTTPAQRSEAMRLASPRPTFDDSPAVRATPPSPPPRASSTTTTTSTTAQMMRGSPPRRAATTSTSTSTSTATTTATQMPPLTPRSAAAFRAVFGSPALRVPTPRRTGNDDDEVDDEDYDINKPDVVARPLLLSKSPSKSFAQRALASTEPQQLGSKFTLGVVRDGGANGRKAATPVRRSARSNTEEDLEEILREADFHYRPNNAVVRRGNGAEDLAEPPELELGVRRSVRVKTPVKGV